ncbi:MAG TPA: hypothetical protein PKN28_00345 [Clostridiales bacterium]|nr:hypothetical protein [Clostridiales bacterium]
MALGGNVHIGDKLIKKTTDKASKARKASNANIAGNASNPIGQPSANPETATYATKKATFYIKEDLLKRLHNFAYWDRHSLTDAFNLVLTDGLKGKNTKDRE